MIHTKYIYYGSHTQIQTQCGSPSNRKLLHLRHYYHYYELKRNEMK